MAGGNRTPESAALRLHDAIAGLRRDVAREGGEIFDRWRPRIEREEFLWSARNLAYYLALRHHDLREIQVELMPLGLSSLGRCEARVLPNLNAVLAALDALCGTPGESSAAADTEAFFRGHELLRAQTEAVLGPTPAHRAVRVMVTLPSEAAASYNLVRRLVFGGMDVARINCAHDGAPAWRAHGRARSHRSPGDRPLVPRLLRPERPAVADCVDDRPAWRARSSR